MIGSQQTERHRGNLTMWRYLARFTPALLLALVLGVSTAGEALAQGATPDVRRELAPTGALRFGLLPATQSFAVGADLGTKLARRLGVPYVPVAYANATAALDAPDRGRSTQWSWASIPPGSPSSTSRHLTSSST